MSASPIPPRDRLLALFREPTLARLLALACFFGVLVLFRHLWATLIFFVAFERSIRWIELKVHARTGWPRKRIVLGIVATYLLAFALSMGVFVLYGVEHWASAQSASTDFLDELKHHPLYDKYKHHIDNSEALMGHAKEYAGQALKYASAVGRFFVQAMIGFVLGVVYRLEAHELDLFEDQIEKQSLIGRVLRWCEHVADAVSVTMQLQFVVAAFNTVTTLPVLLLLGIPHIPSLMALIFVSALVPVIGNLVAGTVLCLLAYQAKGMVGLGIFMGVTFLLHKVESYYLSPRLTAQHVRVPGFVLIVSLIAFEHVFGFVGVFLSFPSLFVAARIRGEFVKENEAALGVGDAASTEATEATEATASTTTPAPTAVTGEPPAEEEAPAAEPPEPA